MEANDFNLLGKLSAGDMVALKNQYDKQCLVALYARSRRQHVVNQLEGSMLHKNKMCTSNCKVFFKKTVRYQDGIFEKAAGTRRTDTGSVCTLNMI